MTLQEGAGVDLRAIPFFAQLPDEAIRSILAGIRMEKCGPGTVLSSPGQPADALSIVCSGRLKVSQPGGIRGTGNEELGPGGWSGAGAVLLGPPDVGTVVVAEDAVLAKIPRSCIDDLIWSSVAEALGVPGIDAPPAAAPDRETRPGPDRSAVSSGGIRRSRACVGLALSGGGAKAFAHLGALKVLRGAGIQIDLLAGTSAGAIVAAMFCAGKSMPEMFAFADQLRGQVLRRDGMWDFMHPPTVGLIRGERTRALYDRVLDARTFEELLKPLAVPAADLLTGEAVIQRTGSLSDAIRASAGIPGLFAPWPHGGRFLIEGGLVNPLPVSLLREQGADLVIGSQVLGSPAEMRVEPPNVPSPHLLGLVAARANAILDHHVRGALPEADVLIRPEMDDYDVLDYPMAEELIALGEAAAEAQIPQIRSRLRATRSTTVSRTRAAGTAPMTKPAGLQDG